MPNHAHMLLWYPEPDYTIERTLQAIKQSLSRRAIRYLRLHNPRGLKLLATGQKGPPYALWQDGGGYDRNMVDAKVVRRAVEYIHGNPVRKELCAYSDEWPWSSAREWESPGRGPLELDLDSFPM